MRSTKSLFRVLKEFFDVDNIIDITELKSGHINSTYLIEFPTCRYILQLLNNKVFQSPFGVMNNVNLVTDHIRKKVIYDGRSVQKSVLNFVKTRYGQTLALVDGEYWRCMEFVEGGITYEHITSPKIFEEAGKAVGDFQYLLHDFHTRLLDDTIPHFHDTPYRFERFKELIKNSNDESRLKECEKEIDFIMAHKNIMDFITSRVENKEFPRRVCHNDTKISNIMVDEKTGKFMCMIDLDTVMKGSLLYDYGDALRMGASTAKEDERDLSKVGVDLELVDAFTRGFLYETRPRNNTIYITDAEINSLYYGFLIITLELGMRFLQDYFENDKYFKVSTRRPKHNLERARNQLRLVEEIEKHKEDIENIIQSNKKKLDELV